MAFIAALKATIEGKIPPKGILHCKNHSMILTYKMTAIALCVIDASFKTTLKKQLSSVGRLHWSKAF